MENCPVEISAEEQIASASDMLYRFGKSSEIYVNEIRDGVVFYE